ncbi:MAG TPA: MBL fold metallo-hydrolase, partial [Deltaproteobacteria bacterium]|nr:MBL fold metallo-hydrolase [Deltaproteobacteria bacterium]
MRIEILGCSGSVMPGFNTTSILINGKILIDVGSAASVLPESSLAQIRNILITHSHIDHIKELPFLIDALCS